ncbi:MAG: hypothetical protein KGZ42_07635 [Melioribacter sp.]|nr:hypothetical protein [Melioribacter sp.]
MARDKTIKFLRTTKSNLDTQKNANNLLAGEPYLITDENRIAVGTAVNAYSDMAKKSEVDAKKTDNVSATSRVLGRKSSGEGAIEELTLSEILDFIGSASKGDILYRGDSSWARLPKGTNGQVLTLASDIPSWASPSGGSAPLISIRETNFSTTSVSYVDSGLELSLEANATYLFEFNLVLYKNTSAGNIIFVLPTGASFGVMGYLYSGGSQVWGQSSNSDLDDRQISGGNSAYFKMTGKLTMGSTSGSVKFRMKSPNGDNFTLYWRSNMWALKQ